ncbi:MAG: hypothetical protein K6C05_08110 [Anaerovibrio sp.]|uniref:hypothetical protein n=1 Tax=Anaerovibrio sp. TaxID=1872532 RepID=UPI0025F7B67D|nr:hypothetical protein [Anaerovibrio sp.]MCR5176804.1 hypothetical protein [Anaerovibrio sp.]
MLTENQKTGIILDDISDEIISIGELLVNYGGLGAALIEKLEEPVALIEKIRLAHEAGKSVRMSVDRLLSKLVELKNTICQQLPEDKKMVFFLPYKASMWDSLESVWERARDEGDCDAVVMPIPYCDRNPDGSAKEWHWEGNEFPEYVPITNYQNVDLAAVHPDKIYIHNPYDAYNRVTSVAPEYYSDKLKKYTDQLIYIPYFISNEAGATPEWAERHARMPVYVNADIIVQQSEKMRAIYIQALVNLYGEDTRHIWEKKVKGWGSPKLDKARHTKKEDQDIPADWLAKIKKADGTWKKIVMYGTGLGKMLESGEKLLDKIESVLKFFYGKKGDVTLLWRPHPLIPATLGSMRPELSKRYTAMVEKYKKENWGIFDDTTDLNRSIAICDAYYGDDSSVIQLFQGVKKPVMVEDVDIMNG